jgi:hypothetical protein
VNNKLPLDADINNDILTLDDGVVPLKDADTTELAEAKKLVVADEVVDNLVVASFNNTKSDELLVV